MANMNMIQALNSAMDIMLARDPAVVIMGEDVGYFGGVFRCTDGLQRKYGEHRVLDSPIAEGGIMATARRQMLGGVQQEFIVCGRHGCEFPNDLPHRQEVIESSWGSSARVVRCLPFPASRAGPAAVSHLHSPASLSVLHRTIEK